MYTICALDVDYHENQAHAAAVVFEGWFAEEVTETQDCIIDSIEAYEPGSFYKRELPCLIEVIPMVNASIDLFIVDGHVWLNDLPQPGLGAYLFQAFGQEIPVIGIAKSKFSKPGKYIKEVFRGKSRSPLFVSSIGIRVETVVEKVEIMYGPHRIPTMLKHVDRLSRNWAE